jgi:nitrate reductase alpha subunit
MDVTRRDFLKTGLTGGTVLGVGGPALALQALQPVVEVPNPLEHYPARDWEHIYRDQYRYDGSFTWVCSPNCTHECRLRGFVRNGVFLRSEQNYDSDKVTDLLGNRATPAWNPRGCLNGFTFQRRVYGPYRLRYPLIRQGWRRWADDGFPELTPELRSRYKFDARGQDELVRVTWDEAYTYAAKGMIAIARRYSGEDGRRRLLTQGYPPEMLTHWEGAGTRTFKLRGGMGLLGVIGKYGMYRFANTLALLDAHVRGVGPAQARGGRNWSNYTWHGDQAPGFPFVHGLQASDVDFNQLRFAKLHIGLGKNLVENKRSDNHFFIELMERGATIVCIVPEYSPPATKADYWIPVRPNSDTALLLGLARILIDEGWYDTRYIKRFTDLPLLVRSDTLKRLKPEDIFPGYRLEDISAGPSMTQQGLTARYREKLGDFVVWDARTHAPRVITRDDVGDRLEAKGIDPVLEGTFCVTTVSGDSIEVMPLFEAYKLHLRDYDLDTVHEITHAPKELIRRLAKDLATIKPAAIHIGEGINHWFHATLVNRACYLPLMLTGNVGEIGSGCHTWAGNYKAGLFQGSEWTGPGFKGWIAEDPFAPHPRPGGRWPGHPGAHQHIRRGGGLLGTRRQAADRRHAQVRPEGLHRPGPPADSNEAHVVHQREPHQQRQVGLRAHQERQSPGGADHLDRHRDDGLLRVRRHRPGGELLGRDGTLRGHRGLFEPVPPDLEGRHPPDLRHARRPAHPGRDGGQAGRATR